MYATMHQKKVPPHWRDYKFLVPVTVPSALRHNADNLPVLAVFLESYNARYLRKESVVPPDTDVDSRLKPRSALANDDAAGRDQLSPEPLHTETLGIAVATVAGASDALLVCHDVYSLLANCSNFNFCVALAMPAADPVSFAPLLLEDENFLSPPLAHNRRLDSNTRDHRVANRDIFVATEKKNAVELDARPDRLLEAGDVDCVLRSYFVLLTGYFNNSVHRGGLQHRLA